MLHLLGLALAAVLPFLALTAYLSFDLIARESGRATQDVQRSADVMANSIERVVSRIRILLARVVQRERVLALDPANCDPALLAIRQLNVEYTNLITASGDGRRICSALAPAQGTPDHVRPEQFLDSLRARRSFTLGPPTRGDISGKWVVYAAEPIVRGGELAGALGLGIDLAALTSVLDPRALPMSGVTLVIDRSGTILSRKPDAQRWIGADVTGLAVVRPALQGEGGTLRGADLNGIDRIWAYAPVRGTDWIVLAGIPASEVLEGPRSYTAWILGIGTLITLGVMLLSRWLARRIAAPIEAIARAAPSLGVEGAQPLAPTGPAEAMALAEELNRRHARTLEMERSLREERARLHGLVASAMDAVVTVDADHRIVLFNAAAERMFGLAPDAVLGTPLEQLLPPRFRMNHAAHMARFVAAGTTSRQMGALGTVHGRRANGEEFPVEASISQVKVGGQRYLTAIVRDITERVRAEAEVRALNASLEQRVAERTAELEAANKELQAFDYSISHDLRAPLSRIQGFAAALREDCGERLDSAGRGFLDRIEATSRDMDRLVNDMLELSLLSRREIDRAEVDVSAIARSILDGLRRADSGRQVETAVQAGLTAWADPGLTRIALENLIGNAWKFTSRRDVARIEVGATEFDGRSRAFFVRDNGAGFDPAHAERLFEPFRRLHSKADFEGTGVGLATVDRIVHRHGGTTFAEGAVGAGATFYFTLQPGGAPHPEDRMSHSGNP